jgi:hypothetical protein
MLSVCPAHASAGSFLEHFQGFASTCLRLFHILNEGQTNLILQDTHNTFILIWDLKLSCRNINSNTASKKTCVNPTFSVFTRLSENYFTNLNDLSGLFSQGNKLGRAD